MLKFAIVGCGRIAKRHSDLLGEGQIEGAELVAVADQHLDRAKAIGEAKNVPAYADMHDMMKGGAGCRDRSDRKRFARQACH